MVATGRRLSLHPVQTKHQHINTYPGWSGAADPLKRILTKESMQKHSASQ